MAKVCKQEENEDDEAKCIEGTTAWWPKSAAQIFAANRASEVCSLFNTSPCTKDEWNCDVCVSNVETFVEKLVGQDAESWYQGLKKELKGETLLAIF